MLGILKVLEKVETNVTRRYLQPDGTISGSDLMKDLQKALSETVSGLPTQINKLPQWHWHYLLLSFECFYGSIEELIKKSFNIAKRGSNQKSQQIKQLQQNNFNYEENEVDFSAINQTIKNSFDKSLGKKSTLSTDLAMLEILKKIATMKEAYIYKKSIGALFSKGMIYQNLYNPSWYSDLKKFIDFFKVDSVFKKSQNLHKCSFCSSKYYQLEPIESKQMNELFPVFSQFPNAYWSNFQERVLLVCSFCKFITIHHHLSLTQLSDNSEIFINAPSFKQMYYLNKFVQTTFSGSDLSDYKQKRQLLAISIIDYSIKVTSLLGTWTAMNIEIVSKYRNKIEFFSLPYETVQLISDRSIAALLSEIGEFKILNLVLDRTYSKLLELGYRLLRIALKSINDRNKVERAFINDHFFLPKNRTGNLNELANKILKLYGLIEQKTKRSFVHGHTNTIQYR